MLNDQKKTLLAAGFIVPWLLLLGMAAFWLAPPAFGDDASGDAQGTVITMTVATSDSFVAERVKGGMRLSWSNPESNFMGGPACAGDSVRSYEYQWKDVGEGSIYWQDASSDGERTKFKYRDVDHREKFATGHRYDFQMRTRMSNPVNLDQPYYSDWVSAQALWPTSAASQPSAPDGLRARAVSSGVELTWTAVTDMSIKEFVIRRYNTTGPRNEQHFRVSNMGEAAWTYTDTTANARDSYGYFIKSVNNRGHGHESNGAYIDR